MTFFVSLNLPLFRSHVFSFFSRSRPFAPCSYFDFSHPGPFAFTTSKNCMCEKLHKSAFLRATQNIDLFNFIWNSASLKQATNWLLCSLYAMQVVLPRASGFNSSYQTGVISCASGSACNNCNSGLVLLFRWMRSVHFSYAVNTLQINQANHGFLIKLIAIFVITNEIMIVFMFRGSNVREIQRFLHIFL